MPFADYFLVKKNKKIICKALKSEGDVRGVYIRLGSSTRQAGPEFIAEMKRQQENKTFDQLPCPSHSIEALDLPFIEKLFKEAGREVHEQQLISLGILTPFAGRNVVTYGGLILFGKPDFRMSLQSSYDVKVAWEAVGKDIEKIVKPRELLEA